MAYKTVEPINFIQRIYHYIIKLLFRCSYWERIENAPSLQTQPLGEREITNFCELIDKYPIMTELTDDEKKTFEEQVVPSLLKAKEFLIKERQKYKKESLPSEIKIHTFSDAQNDNVRASVKILRDGTIFYSLPKRRECGGGMKKVTFKVYSSIDNTGVFSPVAKKIFKKSKRCCYRNKEIYILLIPELAKNPNIFVPSSDHSYLTTRTWENSKKRMKPEASDIEYKNIVTYEPVLQPLDTILEEIRRKLSCFITSEEEFFGTFNELIDLYIGVARGLQAIDKAGCIHNDIKPDNILVDIIQENGQRKLVPKVTDFDLLRRKEEGGFHQAMHSGTKKYFLSGQPRSAISDIYALGQSMKEFVIQKLLPSLLQSKRDLDSAPIAHPRSIQLGLIISYLYMWESAIAQMTATSFVYTPAENKSYETYANEKYLYPEIIKDLEYLQKMIATFAKNNYAEKGLKEIFLKVDLAKEKIRPLLSY